MAMNWTCTSCGRFVTLGDADIARADSEFFTRTATKPDEGFRVVSVLKRCPNPECLQSDLIVYASSAEITSHTNGHRTIGKRIAPVGAGSFKFLPTTPAPLSAHAPASVVEDYREAYLIRDLSPKASATLARRALQGMIRDYWGVAKNTLHAELEAIEDKCDVGIYAAMMAVKSVGNIGAHPERDISLIVDIEPGEPQQLLDVIHLLDNEWYVARAAREARIKSMQSLGAQKAEQRAALPKVGGGLADAAKQAE